MGERPVQELNAERAGRLGREALTALPWLTGPDPVVRRSAARALERLAQRQDLP